MTELSRQGMVKATLAAMAAKERPHWSQADMVRAAITAYVAEVYERSEPKPWDDCPDPKPSRTHTGYCQTCGGMMIASATREEWVHPPRGWEASDEAGRA